MFRSQRVQFLPMALMGMSLTTAWGEPKPAARPDAPGAADLVIPGQVFDHMGSGVDEMTVSIYRSKDGVPVGDAIAETKTDEYGDFSLSVPGDLAGTFLVRMTKTGLKSMERAVELGGERPAPFLDAQAVGSLRLHGRVTTAADEFPVAGAAIEVTDGFGRWTSTSDEKGRFVIENLGPGEMELRVTAEGYATVNQRVPAEFETEPVEIRLKPGWSAAVRVLDPLGNPIPDVFIEALDEFKERLLTETTAENGEATFTGLNPESNGLKMRFSHFVLPAEEEFVHELVRSKDEVRVSRDFQVSLAGRIKGTVTEASTLEPVYSARIMAGEWLGGRSPKSWSDTDGEYALSSLPAGETVVTVHHRGYAPTLQVIEVEAGRTKTVNFQLQPGKSVTGKVVDDQGEPLGGVEVFIGRWRGYETAGIRTLTDEEGRFVVEGAPDDPFELTARRRGYEPQSHDIEKAGKERNFTLKPAEEGEGPEAMPKVKVGGDVPDMVLKTLDGKELKLRDMHGKVLLLDFWATWCGPCLREMPTIKKVWGQFGKRDDFVMIGISLDVNEQAMRQCLAKENIDWVQVFDNKGWEAAAAREFGVDSIPATFLVDRQGRIAAVRVHADQLSETISNLLK